MEPILCPNCHADTWEFVYTGQTAIIYLMGTNPPWIDDDPERIDEVTLTSINCADCGHKVDPDTDLYKTILERFEAGNP